MHIIHFVQLAHKILELGIKSKFNYMPTLLAYRVDRLTCDVAILEKSVSELFKAMKQGQFHQDGISHNLEIIYQQVNLCSPS
jgi:hypothetical protein